MGKTLHSMDGSTGIVCLRGKGWRSPVPQARLMHWSAFVFFVFFFIAGCKTSHLRPYSEQEELKFRSDRARELADPRGDLALVGALTLKQGINTVKNGTADSIPTEHLASPLELTKRGPVVVVSKVPAGSRLDGRLVTSGEAIPSDSEHWLTAGSLALKPYRIGDAFDVAIYDSASPYLRTLHPLNWFPPSPVYRVKADWVPIPKSELSTIQRTNGGSDLKKRYAGYAEFSLDGKGMRLYGWLESNMIFFVFRDPSSRNDTDQTGRFVEALFSSSAFEPSFDPSKKEEMMLDFNQAVNPDCAYNPYYACPIAPPENRLPIVIPAGEKRY